MFHELMDDDGAGFPNSAAERYPDPELVMERAILRRGQETRMLALIERMETDELKKTMADCFYLRGCPIPLWAYEGEPMPTSTRFVSITGLSGSGKHDIEASIGATIAREEHTQHVIVGRSPGMVVPDIKSQYQTDIPGGQLSQEWIGLSMVGYFAFLQEVRQSHPNHVISYRGPVGVWNSLMLYFGESEFAELLSTAHKDRAVWSIPSLAELAQSEPKLIDETWAIMLKTLKKGQAAEVFPWSRWPMVSQSSPTIMISNLSPEQCWQLQEIPSPNRDKPRPFGVHPFTQTQMKIMRLIHAAFVRDLDFVQAFGGFDPDYANGGAQRIAQELMSKSYKLYRRFKE